MKKTGFLFLVALIPIGAFFSCHSLDKSVTASGGAAYLDLPSTTYPYFSRSSGRQEDSLDNIATLGRVLFYDRHLSVNNAISCASCHKQAYAFSDNTDKSFGFENRKTTRNTPAIQNLGFSGFDMVGVFNGNTTVAGGLFWDGRENNLRNLISRPLSNHIEMGVGDVSELGPKLTQLSYYAELFKKAYGSSDITVDRLSNAIATYMMAIKAVNTRFDQQQKGLASFTALEAEGEALFSRKYNCASCHNEQLNGYFSGQFANIGLDNGYSDKGLGTITGKASNNGAFKVPNLRNVALTAPYMHDGRFKTLDEVIEHYNKGIQPDAALDERLKDDSGAPMRMNISAQEKTAIIAFLNTLTDVDMITNPAFSDPFKTR